MKRLIKFEVGEVDSLNAKKYILQQEYEGFGVYQEKCPSGFYMHQSWLVADSKKKVMLVVDSFNDCCKEEVLDMVDRYKENKKFGIKGQWLGFHREDNKDVALYRMHHSGREI